jgi:hypothetical protein
MLLMMMRLEAAEKRTRVALWRRMRGATRESGERMMWRKKKKMSD